MPERELGQAAAASGSPPVLANVMLPSRPSVTNGSERRARLPMEGLIDADGHADPPSLARVEGELAERGQWPELLALYELGIERASDEDSGRALMLKAGLLLQEKLGDPVEAEALFRRVLSTDPEHPDALDALRALLEGQGRLTEAADLLDAAILSAAPEDKIELCIELAEIAHGGLEQPERAVNALRFAYQLDPRRLDILRRARAIYFTEGSLEEAKAVLDAEAEATLASGTADPEALRAVGEAYRVLGVRLLETPLEHALAEECLLRARQLGDNDALSRLDELAHLRRDWEARAKHLRDQAMEARDKRKAAELYVQAAELFLAFGRDPVRSDESLKRALILAPGFAPALSFIVRSVPDPTRKGEVVRRLEAAALDVKDSATRAAILLRAARLLAAVEEMAEDKGGTMAAYEKVLSADPASHEAAFTLAGLLEMASEYAKEAEVFERHLTALSDPHAAVLVHLELGRVYAELVGDVDRSRAHFENALRLSPENFAAASALRALYTDAHEPRPLLAVLRVLTEHSPDRRARLDLLQQAAEVAAGVSPEERMETLRRVLLLDPSQEKVEQELEQLAESLKRGEALAETLAEVAARARGARAAALHAKAARWYDLAGRPREAIEGYKRALAIRPDDAATNEALERLLRERNDPSSIVEIIEGQLSRATEASERVSLLAKLGSLHDRELGDAAKAVEAFQRLLKLDPEDPVALANLDDLYRRLGQRAEQAEILARREAVARAPRERAELAARRARVLAQHLDRKPEAAQLYLACLSELSDDEGVITGLDELVREGIERRRIAEVLEPVFAQRNQYARQAEMIRVILEEETDDARAAELARRGARLLEARLQDLDGALDLFARAVAAEPSDLESLEAVLRLSRELERPERAMGLFSAILKDDTLPKAVASQVSSALGALFDDLDKKAEAIEAYRRALRADGSNAAAAAALERLLGAEERWAELAKLLEEQLQGATDEAARIELGVRLATIREERLSQLDDAIAACRAVLAVRDDERGALARLADLLDKKGELKELLVTLDRLREVSAEAEVKVAIDLRAGDALRVRGNDPAAALERYRRVLAKSPDQPAAVAGLEALLASDLRAEAAALLAPIYLEKSRFHDAVGALEAQREATSDRARRGQIAREIARIYLEQLDQAGAAYETLVRAYEEGLLEASERAELIRVALAANAGSEVADALERAADKSPADVELLRELAGLYDGPVLDPERAARTYRRVLEVAPGDREALLALERLHGAGNDPAALAEVLLERAAAAPAVEEQVALYKRASAIFEEAVEDLARATDAMVRARGAAPRDRNTLIELARLYRAQGQLEKVAEIRSIEAQIVEEPQEKARVLLDLAAALTDLGVLEEAIAGLAQAVALAPDSAEARQRLEALQEGPAGGLAAQALEPVYRAAGDWSKLVTAYERLASASTDPAEKVERLLAIRSIYEERLGRPDHAFQAAARALRLAPTSEEVLSALERLAKIARAHEELLATLEDLAESLTPRSPERVSLRIRFAKNLEGLRGDKAAMLAAWRRVLEERPGEPGALEAIVRISTDLGDFDTTVGALESLSEVIEEPAAKVEKLRAAARLIELQAGEPTRIIRCYERIIALAAGDPEALGKLDALYAQAGRHRDRERVISEAISRTPAGPDQELLRLRLARLLANRLGEPEAGLRLLQQIIERRGAGSSQAVAGALEAVDALMEAAKSTSPPLAAQAAEIAEPLWREQGNALKLVACKEARVTALADRGERRRLLAEIARTYERDLNQPALGFLALTRAFNDDPRDPEIIKELERLSRLADTREELADLYVQVLPDIEHEERALDLARRAAQIYDAEAARPESAVPLFERVLASAPGDREVLLALERIARTQNEPRALVRALRRRLEFPTATFNEKKVAAGEIAQILAAEGDIDSAFEAYRVRLSIDPQDRAALVAMAELAGREDRPRELAEALEQLAPLTDRGEEKARILVELGKVRWQRLGLPVEAVEVLAQALKLRRALPPAIAELTGIFRAGGPGKPQAGAVLAPIAEESGDYPSLIACLEAQLEGETEPAAKKPLLVRIADTYEERLGRGEHAFTYSCRALHEDLRDDTLRMRVERLAQAHGLFEDLAAFYLDEVDQLVDAELAVTLRRRVAEIYERELKDHDRAISEHTKVLEVAPGDPETLRSLERLYRSMGSFDSLAEVYRRRIAQAEDPSARIQLMRELARVQAEFLDDSAGAIATLRRLLELDENDVEAMDRLAKLCAKEGRWSEQADILERLLPILAQKGRPSAQARLDLAQARIDHLDDRTGGDALLREILEAEPRHAPTREYLRERLENALADDDGRTAIIASDLLSEALRKTGEPQPLIEVLRVRSGLLADPDARVETQLEIAKLYRTELKQPELAFTALTQAFREAPYRAEIRAELEALAEELMLIEDLVDAYIGAVDQVRDPDARLDLETRIAELLENKVGDRDRAVVAWERVLKRRPMDPKTLEALDRLNTAVGRWGAVADVLEKRIELAADNDEQSYDLLQRLGVVWEERLGEPEEALRIFRKARVLKPREARTLRALARLVPAEEAPEELLAVLQSLAERTNDAQELAQILPRMAELHAEHFGQKPEAIEVWKRVLELDPTSAQALGQLEKLYEDTERWADLVQLLEKQLRTARDDREVTRLQRRLGFVRGTRLGSVEDAIQSWVTILRRNPSDVEALEALRKIYRNANRWDDLVAVLRKLVPLQGESEGVKSIRFELAEIFLHQLGRKDEGIESAKRVLDVEPHSVADLLRLEEIFVSAGAFHDAVRVMNARAEMIEDPGEKADILFNVASIYETKMARRAGAASAYERILAAEPKSAKAYDALAAIYENAGDYKKLVEIKNRRLDHIPEPEERKRILFEIIDIYEKRLGHKDLGFTAACRAFSEEGADPRAQAIAERLAEETEAWEILVEVIEEQVEAVPVPRAVELRKRLAEIYLEKLGEPARAERQLDQVISVRPEDDGARAQLGALYESQSRWRDLIGLTLDRVEIAADLEVKKGHLRRIAEIEEKELGDLAAAIRNHRRILDLDPGDAKAIDELARLLPEVEDWMALVEVLGRKAELDQEPSTRGEVLFRVAEVWDREVKDRGRAIDSYRDVLATDPGHRGALAALERLFAETKRFDALRDVYEAQVTQAKSDADAIDLLSRIARLEADQFHDLAAAAASWERLLARTPEHLAAYEMLEAVLQEAEDWPALAEVYQRHLERANDSALEAQIYLALGATQDEHLDRADLAEKSYQAALARDATSRDAVHRLGELHERQGSWFNALEMMQREIRMPGAQPDAVELHYRIGKISEDRLGDRPAATIAFRRAIELDAGYLPALRALAEIHRQEENWDEVLLLEAQEAEHSENKQARADRFQQAAETALERLDRVDDAIRYYEASLAAVPDHLPSVRSLADLYFAAEEWERSERLLELLVSRLDRQDDKDELCQQYYRLAYISEKLADDGRALKRYLASYELDSTYLPTLEGLAAALLRAQRWDDAQRVYQTILVHHRDSLTDAEVVDVYYQLGELAGKIGDLDRARRSLDRALELDPGHPPTLRAYAALAERMGEWEEAYDFRTRLVDLLKGEERFAALLLQAALCRTSINDPYRAIDAYAEARRIVPTDEKVLRELAALYRETSQHQRAAEALEDLLKIAGSPEQRRDLDLELANVHETAGDWMRAVEFLNAALDEDADCVSAFEKIEAVLAQQGRWPLLEENYRRMIERLPKDSSQRMKRVVLWSSLGDLYRVKLKNAEGARMAYEVVLKLKPDAHAVTTTLAQLLSQRRETAQDAVKLLHQLVPVVDDPAVPIRELFGLYEALGMRDRALCCLSALILIRVASPVELKAYDLLLKQAPAAPSKALDDKVWRTLAFHPDCRGSLADILSVLYRGGPQLFGGAQEALQLKKKEKVDLEARGRSARAGLRYFNIWRQLTSAMQLPEMDHYHRAGSGQPPRFYPGFPAVLFAGEQHEVFGEMAQRQITWVLARQLACARPELSAVRALVPEDVAAAVEGAIRLFAPDGSGVDLSLDARVVQAWSKAIERSLSERALKALRQPIISCLERQEVRGLAKYLEGAEHTASRVAMLMCGDVRVADRALADADAMVEMSLRRRTRELMLFLVSTDYFTLREYVGVSLGRAAK
ncbi:MAG: tetratricopeptide repeat protein [Deltaproteobacteria bacterium]|nr:tetratricopeptide repeat protein [Deltaproteobacteria bacterium]